MWRDFRALVGRLVRAIPSPVSNEVAPSASPSAAPPAASVARHPPTPVFLNEKVDREAKAAAAGTALERIYYRHRGRHMFKWIHYLPLYDRALGPYVGKSPRVLEIGVAGGGSLQLWRNYLGKGAIIVGTDINPDCKAYEAEGFPIYVGDQSDPAHLARIAADHGPFDIIIDDGSHIATHQVATFKALWPHLKAGGVYVCEDLHTNYWGDDWMGGLNRPGTFIELTKVLIDKLHDKYWRGAEVNDPISEEIEWITQADSITFLHKRTPTPTYMDLVGGEA